MHVPTHLLALPTFFQQPLSVLQLTYSTFMKLTPDFLLPFSVSFLKKLGQFKAHKVSFEMKIPKVIVPGNVPNKSKKFACKVIS